MRRRALVALALAMILAVLTSGCATVRQQMDGAEVEPDTDTSAVAPPLKTVEWSVTDGLLSVLVRNDHDQPLRSAEVTLVGYDKAGSSVGTWGPESMATGSACCEVVELAPGQEFGLYFSVGSADVAKIKLAYRNISWAPKSQTSPTSIIATGHGTTLDAHRTTVAADLKNGPTAVPLALVQAVLRGVSGRLIAVVTGRWSCLQPGELRPIQMQLFQTVPLGTKVVSVTARPVSGPGQPSCAESTAAPSTGADPGTGTGTN